MKTPLQQAKELHAELKKDSSNVEALLRLTEFMSEYDGDDKMILSTDLDAEIELLESEKRYYTGITKLDKILDGFRSNQIIVVSAPPKAGKTQFCVHLARRLPDPTMFLFEESPAEVLYKYKKKGIELPRFATHRQMFEMNIEELYRKMIEAWAKYNSKIFFIDHLHFLLDGKEVGYEIKNVMENLKMFCKRHDFTIFLIAHIAKGHFTEPPGVEAIRDSSFIPQYADTVLMLWRQSVQTGAREHKNVINYTNNLLVNVALNRKINFSQDYNTGLVDLSFNTQTWSYEDSDWYTEWIDEDTHATSKNSNIISQLET